MATNISVWHHFSPFSKTETFPAKTILLQEGKVSRKLFFIEQGCLRTWVNSGQREITTQFFFEGSMVASIESFRTGLPGLYNIETIEPCQLQSVSHRDFEQVINDTPKLKDAMQEHLFRRLYEAQQLFFSFLKNTPQQRYAALLEHQPEILKRVPQHYIASYLGITPVSLSRIRNRR